MKDRILEEYEKGNVVVSGFEGLQVCKLNDIINQPIDGLLYDLNRNEAVVLTFLDDPKWVNDYAVCKVIRILKEKLETVTRQKIALLDKVDELSEPAIREDLSHNA